MYIPINSSWLQNSEYLIFNRFDTCRQKKCFLQPPDGVITHKGVTYPPNGHVFQMIQGLATVKLNVKVNPRLSIAVEFQFCQSRAACPISCGVNPMFHRSFFVFWGLCSKQKTAQKEWLHVIRDSDWSDEQFQEENTRWRLKWTKIGSLLGFRVTLN
jgi:hypothetical protein